MTSQVLSNFYKIKLFVSGKWSDKEKVHQQIRELESMGCLITHDWTQVEQSNRDSKALGEYAAYDINGVTQSNIHVVLMEDPEYAYRGTFTEIGAALALGKRVILMCPFEEGYCTTNVFFHHPRIEHVKTWDEVKELIQKEVSATHLIKRRPGSISPSLLENPSKVIRCVRGKPNPCIGGQKRRRLTEARDDIPREENDSDDDTICYYG